MLFTKTIVISDPADQAILRTLQNQCDACTITHCAFKTCLTNIQRETIIDKYST